MPQPRELSEVFPRSTLIRNRLIRRAWTETDRPATGKAPVTVRRNTQRARQLVTTTKRHFYVMAIIQSRAQIPTPTSWGFCWRLRSTLSSRGWQLACKRLHPRCVTSACCWCKRDTVMSLLCICRKFIGREI